MKTAVVTGAGRGIGLATAELLLKQGWSVVGIYNKTKPPIRHKNFHSQHADLSSELSVVEAANLITKTVTKIDAVVNNAGVALDQKNEKVDVEIIRKTFDINLFNLIEFTEILIPLMPKGSHIINIDSTYGAQSLPIDDRTHVGYRLAKAALNMYTRILAFHLKDKKIIVSSLDPGWVKTEMGYSAGSGMSQPDRETDEVALDILNILKSVNESGFFWRFGKKREW